MAGLRDDDYRRALRKLEWIAYMKGARQRFLKGEAATAMEVRRLYRRAAENVRRDIEKVAPGSLRRGHLDALAAALERRARELTTEVLAAIQAGVRLAVKEAVAGPEQIAADLLDEAFQDRPALHAMFADINERAVLALLSRTRKDGLKLSDRVWRVGERWRNAVRRVIEDGVTRGEDARRMAKDVERYLQPGTWTGLKRETRQRLRVPADVSMEGLRLAVTEMHLAFHEGTILANRAMPSYQGVYWRLSSNHPLPDVCDDYATHDGNGFWPKGQEPLKPHPWCRCQIIPAHEDPNQFTERLRAWLREPGSQPDIEGWYNETARRFLMRPAAWSGLFRHEVRDELASRLRNVEREISGRQTEKVYVLDRQGTVLLAKEGTEDRVEFTTDELRLFEGAILTHNHPTGSSFSLQDIRLAIRTRLSEIRVATTEYIYAMQSAETEWPAESDVIHQFMTTEMQIYAEFREAIRQGRMTKEEAELLHHHTIWERIGQQLRLLYKREGR